MATQYQKDMEWLASELAEGRAQAAQDKLAELVAAEKVRGAKYIADRKARLAERTPEEIEAAKARAKADREAKAILQAPVRNARKVARALKTTETQRKRLHDQLAALEAKAKELAQG